MLSFDRATLDRFRTVVARRLGLQFEDGRLDVLADALRQRLEAKKSMNVAAYLNVLESSSDSGEELRTLVGHLTVSETYFFRIVEHFRALTDIALPERIRITNHHRPLRLLSAGCASGDEAYSLAIVLRESFPQLSKSEVVITGVDINPAILIRAREARYTSWSLRETAPNIQARYFQRDSKCFALNDEIRSMVEFEQRSLADEADTRWGSEQYDIVFCRNAIMYMVPEAALFVVRRLTKALAPGGFLFLSHAETLRGLSQDFHLRHTHGTFYYQKRDQAVLESPRQVASEMIPAMPDIDLSWVETVRRASERIASLSSTALQHAKATGSGGVAVAVPPAPCQAAITVQFSFALDLLRREKYGEALDALSQMPPELAADRDARLLRAVLLTNSGHIKTAETVCQQLLASDELNANAHYIFALCREHAKDLGGAIEHDRTAVYIDPMFSMPHLHLGLLSKRAGDMDSARCELEQANTLLLREDASRILLLGGGFSREALMGFCQAQLQSCGGAS